jgi:hypothetical protein
MSDAPFGTPKYIVLLGIGFGLFGGCHYILSQMSLSYALSHWCNTAACYRQNSLPPSFTYLAIFSIIGLVLFSIGLYLNAWQAKQRAAWLVAVTLIIGLLAFKALPFLFGSISLN